MLQIVFKDGSSVIWYDNSFTDYEYMKQIFVVLKDHQWIGVYNMDSIKYIEYLSKEDQI